MTKNKRVKYYTSENVLEEFYKALAGEWITLDRMERSMYLEGMLPAASVFNPKEKRDWE